MNWFDVLMDFCETPAGRLLVILAGLVIGLAFGAILALLI